MSSAPLRAVIIVAISLSLAGCAGAPSLGPMAQPPASGTQLGIWDRPSPAMSGQTFVLKPNAKGAFVYGCGGPVCVWYAKGVNKKIGQLWKFSDAQGIGVSPVNGDVFIADAGAFDIKVYAPNSKTLVADYPDPGRFPEDVAVDPSGDFYVANSGDRTGGPGSVTVYDPSGTIVRTLHEPDALIGRSVAVDEHRLVLFCFNDRSGLGECDEFPNARGPARRLTLGLGYAGGAAFDAAEHFVVADEVNGIADTFDGSTLCGTYSLAGAGVPVMVAFDRASGLLYNTSSGTRGIAVYPYADCGSGTIHPTLVYDDGLGPYTFMNGTGVTPNVKP